MIRSFADREAEALFHGRYARRLPSNIQRVAQRKLRQLHSAESLSDLAAPPGKSTGGLTWKPGRSILYSEQQSVAALLRLERRRCRRGRDRRLSPRMRDMRDLPPIHPGEQLREEFMKPLGHLYT